MRTKGWLAVPFLAAILTAGPALAASASAPRANDKAAGSFSFQSDYTVAVAKGISIEISQLTYTGDLTGVAIDRGTENTFADGSFAGSGTEYCAACTIDGLSGAFTATYIYWGSGATYSGVENFTQGFGHLSGIVGGGSFKGNVQDNTNSYQYSYGLA